MSKVLRVKDLFNFRFGRFKFIIESTGTGKTLGRGESNGSDLKINKNGKRYLNAEIRSLGTKGDLKEGYGYSQIFYSYILIGVYDGDCDLEDEEDTEENE